MKKIEQKKKMKRILVILGITIMLSGGLWAGWYFGYWGNVTGQVLGSGEIYSVDLDLADFSMDVGSGELENIQNLTLTNNDGFKTLNLNLTVDKTLTEISCPNFENDCNVEFGYANGTTLSNGLVGIDPGTETFQLRTSCDPGSCSQDLAVSIALE